jgi:uncharacterized membrane protein
VPVVPPQKASHEKELAMVEHSASVIIKAPVHQVYKLFTHFDDFPKFMSFIREVTYYDDQRSHWVVQVIRQYEWDAIKEDWLPNQQIGWRSTRGLRNSGKVKFRSLGPESTIIDVYIQYIPPQGLLGQLGESMGINSYFESILQKDLHNFARMVELAPTGALDPMSSHYLFHSESAAARKLVTSKQLAQWQTDPMMSSQALAKRQARIAQEAELYQRQKEEYESFRQLKKEQEQRWIEEQKAILQREAERRRQELLTQQVIRRRQTEVQLDPRHTYAAWARGLGDKDGLRARIPNFTQDPMTSRRPPKISAPSSPSI